jgi:ATP-dependent DNA helicase RecG
MKREDEFNEYKKTTGELNEGMISISSILNKHKKGTLYFGLKNDGTPFRFTITDSTIRDVSRKVFEAIKPQIFPTVTTVDIEGIEVIKVEFSGSDIPYSAFGKYYIRIADEDRELTPSELRKIMINKEYEDNWENMTSEETLDDVDEQMVEKFNRGAVECGRMPEIENYSLRILMEKLGLLRGDKLTNAGRVLFSKRNPIVLKLAVFATEHKTTFLDIARAEGNVFRLIDNAMGYIIRNIRWKVIIDGEKVQRQEIPEIPLDALREPVHCFPRHRYVLPSVSSLQKSPYRIF